MNVIIKNSDEVREIEISNLAFGIDINNYGNDAELMYMIPDESDSDFLDERLITIPLERSGWEIISI